MSVVSFSTVVRSLHGNFFGVCDIVNTVYVVVALSDRELSLDELSRLYILHKLIRTLARTYAML